MWSRPVPADAPDPARTGIASPGTPFAVMPPRELSRPATIALERSSFIAVAIKPPRKFRVDDLVTIIVRQQKKYEADQKLETEKKWDLGAKLSEWFRFYPDHKLGSDNLSNGQPSVKFKLNDKYETDGTSEREDKFTTRITAKVIDVKPNGNLVLEARARQMHTDDGFFITLTGTCRTEDVTPDNTVLSTQLYDLDIADKSSGTVRDATAKGWVPKVLDWSRAFCGEVDGGFSDFVLLNSCIGNLQTESMNEEA
jgi:flagellar L-ring protein precursor FlgH